MSISIADVEKIAKLAKLRFSEDEKIKVTKQLDEILRYMEKLKEINTENITPVYHVHEITNIVREDKVKSWLTQEEALANAPKKHEGHFSVPKVISPE